MMTVVNLNEEVPCLDLIALFSIAQNSTLKRRRNARPSADCVKGLKPKREKGSVVWKVSNLVGMCRMNVCMETVLSRAKGTRTPGRFGSRCRGTASPKDGGRTSSAE